MMKKQCLCLLFNSACVQVLYFLLAVCIICSVGNAAVIKRLLVPRWIQNGTEDAVTLDCEYVYNENDLHLVVKWYFGDIPMPIYQWIPDLNARHVGKSFEGRLDLDFSINTVDTYSKYRALRIIRPTIELSGKYTCQVASLSNTDIQSQNMTIYVPAKQFNLILRETNDGSLNVSCQAEELYPAPELKLSATVTSSDKDSFSSSSSSSTSKAIPFSSETSQTETILSHKESGTYDINVYRTFNSWDLATSREAEFECALEIPGTNYTRLKRIAFFPGTQDSRIEALSNTAPSILLMDWFIFFAMQFFKYSS